MTVTPSSCRRAHALLLALTGLGAGLLAAACGQSGPLYLPDKPQVVAGSGSNPPPANAPNTLGDAGAQPVGPDRPQSLDTEIAPVGQ